MHFDLFRTKKGGHNEWLVAKDTFLKLFPIVKLLKEFWFRQVLLSLVALIFIPLALLNPFFAARLVDGPLMNRSMNGFLRLGFWMGCISVVTMMLQNAFTYWQGRLAIDARETMTRKIYLALTAMSLDYFRRSDRYVNQSIMGADGVEVAVQGLSLIPEMGVALLNLAVKLVVVFYVDWRMGLIALLSPPLYAVQTLVLARRNREIATVEREATLGYSKELGESLGNMDLVKAYRTENYHVKKFNQALKRLSFLWVNNQRFALYFGCISGLLKKLIDAMPVLFASYLVTKGELSLGQMTASLLYVQQFLSSNEKLLDFIPKLDSMAVSVNVFTDFLKLKPRITESPRAKKVDFKEANIVIENLSFAYIPGVPVLQNMSLRIEGGRWTGIKAPSGYGKTTLINLLLRVYDSDEGRILIDGHDVREIKFEAFYEQVSAVLQQLSLSRDPLWKCIAYDKENASMEEIREAAKMAGIHDQIMGFPEGYETSCGDSGLRLSHGQRQRVTIARALLRKPKFLVMDEAFGSVDRETEESIILEMKGKFPQMTVVVVSHHQSVLDHMDRVIDLTKMTGTRTEKVIQETAVL